MSVWNKATIASLVTTGCLIYTRAQQRPVNPLLPSTGSRAVALRGNRNRTTALVFGLAIYQ